MAEMVLVRVVRNLTDMREGDEAWVNRTEQVAGMVNGGYLEIVAQRDTQRRVRKAVTGGEDQAESVGDEGDAERVR